MPSESGGSNVGSDIVQNARTSARPCLPDRLPRRARLIVGESKLRETSIRGRLHPHTNALPDYLEYYEIYLLAPPPHLILLPAQQS